MTATDFLICFVLFLVFRWLVLPIATLIHEMGHAIGVLALTSLPVEIRLGRGGSYRSVARGRLRLTFHFRGASRGFCAFHRSEVSPLRQILIALSGPSLSLLASVGFLITALSGGLPRTLEYLFIVCFYANFHLTVSTAIPRRIASDSNEGPVWETDGYTLLRLFRTVGKSSPISSRTASPSPKGSALLSEPE